ncbi:MAG: hypothetical protein HC906_11605 [Bacteroidales bacterium]|nr:hypothetical protein [Bacteroidales bacterium]
MGSTGDCCTSGKINEHFISSHYDLSTDSINLLEKEGYAIHGDDSEYRSLIEFVESKNLSTPANYEYVKERIDIDNFINYQLAQIYYYNGDWPGNNIKFWKKSSGGKWRWILYDTDFGYGLYGSSNYRHNTLAFATEPNGPTWPNPAWSTLLLRKLLANKEFKNAFVNRFADNLNTILKPDYVEDFLGKMELKYTYEMPSHFDRWSQNMSVWNSHINIMKNFGRNRPHYIQTQLMDRFSIESIKQVDLNISETGAGKIKVNSITPWQYPWTGEYFYEIPIELTAKPEPGYRFVRWEGSSTSTSATISMDMTSDVQLTAIFEVSEPDYRSVIIMRSVTPPAQTPVRVTGLRFITKEILPKTFLIGE